MRPYRPLLLFLAILALAVVWAAGGLPWWGRTLLVLGVLFALGAVGQSLVRASWQGALAKGQEETSAALRGASIIVHSVSVVAPPWQGPRVAETGDRASPTTQPSPGSAADTPSGPNSHVAIELTVSPAAGPTGRPGIGDSQRDETIDGSDEPPSWEPSNFTLVPMDSVVDRREAAHLQPDVAGGMTATVESAEVLDEGRPGPPGPASGGAAGVNAQDRRFAGWLVGRHRVRLVFGIPPGMPQRVKLRYLLEEFGEIDLPDGPHISGRLGARLG